MDMVVFVIFLSYYFVFNLNVIPTRSKHTYHKELAAAVEFHRSFSFLIQPASYLTAINQTKSGSQHGGCWRLDNREIKPQTNHILLILVVSYFKNKNSRESIRTDSYQALYIVTKRKHLEISL